MVLFEIGSLLSAVATNVNFLIGARAFQGIGAAGIFVSAIVSLLDSYLSAPIYKLTTGFSSQWSQNSYHLKHVLNSSAVCLIISNIFFHLSNSSYQLSAVSSRLAPSLDPFLGVYS